MKKVIASIMIVTMLWLLGSFAEVSMKNLSGKEISKYNCFALFIEMAK